MSMPPPPPAITPPPAPQYQPPEPTWGAGPPNAGQTPPPKKKGGWLRTALIVVAVVVVLGIIGAAMGGGDDEGTRSTTTSTAQTASPSPSPTQIVSAEDLATIVDVLGDEFTEAQIIAKLESMSEEERKKTIADAYTVWLAENSEPTPKPLTAAQERAKYKNRCKAISFKVLNRDADLLVDRKYRITGQVMQIRDAGADNYWTGFPGGVEPRTQMLVSVTRDEWGYWDDNVAVVYDGRLAKVFEEDVIKVWGDCLGQYTYESVAGYNITVPLIHARYVSK